VLASALLGLSFLAAPIFKPQLDYRLVVDSNDLSFITVELSVRNAPAALVLAAAAHPEYDDKYWRYIEALQATDGAGSPIAVTRSDSVLWRLHNRAGAVLVRYRLRIPEERLPRAAWRPFLTRSGGLVGGPHSFLYVLGLEKLSARVALELPRGWTIATALQPGGPNAFLAPDLHTLMEAPLQVGLQSEWSFEVKGIPHRVFYWRLPNATPFDSAAFVDGIRRVAGETVALFRGTPYRGYAFLYQDGAYGGLEHPASVTLGAPSAALAGNPQANLLETAHEFFHTWNLMHFQPVEYLGLTYRPQPPVAELWFSEGLTLFYADLLVRRAGLPPPHPTRVAHLEAIIARYLASPGHSRFSAEAISRVAYNAGPGALGDYGASVHLVGEVIGAMLDLLIRDATKGARSMDDVMRLMDRRFAAKGFTSDDVRQAVEEVCGCSAREVFERSVSGAGPIDFNRYLGLVGLHAKVTWEPALEQNGKPMRDLRVFGYVRGNEDSLRLIISDPGSAWGRAGLHSHDVLLSLNGTTVKSWPELRTVLSGLALGDTVSFTVRQQGVERSVRFPLTGYDRPVVQIETIATASAEQRRLLQSWSEGK
jgi:predicted metalloprotease with PDZ domain